MGLDAGCANEKRNLSGETRRRAETEQDCGQRRLTPVLLFGPIKETVKLIAESSAGGIGQSSSWFMPKTCGTGTQVVVDPGQDGGAHSMMRCRSTHAAASRILRCSSLDECAPTVGQLYARRGGGSTVAA